MKHDRTTISLHTARSSTADSARPRRQTVDISPGSHAALWFDDRGISHALLPARQPHEDRGGRFASNTEEEASHLLADYAQTMRRLAAAVADPDIDLRRFINAAEILKSLHDTSARKTASMERAQIFLANRTHWRPGEPEGTAANALHQLLAAGSGWRRCSAASVASSLKVSRATLCRDFSRAFGTTFMVCRRAIVIRAAVLELTLSHDQVAQIAYRLGYDHPSNLDRDFHKVIGGSPRDFRRLISESAAAEPSSAP